MVEPQAQESGNTMIASDAKGGFQVHGRPQDTRLILTSRYQVWLGNTLTIVLVIVVIVVKTKSLLVLKRVGRVARGWL